jgi:hypothetical protein
MHASHPHGSHTVPTCSTAFAHSSHCNLCTVCVCVRVCGVCSLIWQVCSTTTDFNIAVHFMLQSPSGLPTLPKEVLLLRIVVRNCNHFGGMISYLSVNPGDAEVI